MSGELRGFVFLSMFLSGNERSLEDAEVASNVANQLQKAGEGSASCS